MTRDEIVLLAKEADLWLTSDERIAAVVRFAELVADAERQECIDLVAMYGGPVILKAAIRARGEK